MKASGIITLLTDFGLSDAYVAMMKGVILSLHPLARLIDITHQVKPGSIFQAAILLEEAFSFFPSGTVHLAIVDPGVGSSRRPIALKVGVYFFIGPDNGLFWPIIQKHGADRIVHLTEKKFFHPLVSPTFQGREIFAPVAALLSKGIEIEALGPVIQDPIKLERPVPIEKNGVLYGQILRVDHFGNLITNISRQDLGYFLQSGRPKIKIGTRTLTHLASIYADVKPGDILALIDSSGYLEIAVNQGRALDHFGADAQSVIGMPVYVGR